VLLVYGDRDQVVPPYDSAQLIAQALARGGNDDYTARLLPGVDHNLKSVDATAPPRLAPEALEAASGWVLERSADPGARAVFDLRATGAFKPCGRYGARAAAGVVLAQLGGALLLAAGLGYAAWKRLKRRAGQPR
jgi:hypothetical protein